MDVDVYLVYSAQSQQGHKLSRVSEGGGGTWASCWEIKNKILISDCYQTLDAQKSWAENPCVWHEEACQRHCAAKGIKMCKFVITIMAAETRFDRHIHTPILFKRNSWMLHSDCWQRAHYSSHVTCSRILCSTFVNRKTEKQAWNSGILHVLSFQPPVEG